MPLCVLDGKLGEVENAKSQDKNPTLSALTRVSAKRTTHQRKCNQRKERNESQRQLRICWYGQLSSNEAYTGDFEDGMPIQAICSLFSCDNNIYFIIEGANWQRLGLWINVGQV